jgi:hypothetical protein
MKLAAALSMALVGMMGTASADPWKDESGHGKSRGSYERHWDRDRDHHRGRHHGWDRGERHGSARYRSYDVDRTGSLNCRNIIVRRENGWGETVTKRIQRCG